MFFIIICHDKLWFFRITQNKNSLRLSFANCFWLYKCRKKGILSVAIDQSIPLSDQGYFDIVLHKVRFLVPLYDFTTLVYKCKFLPFILFGLPITLAQYWYISHILHVQLSIKEWRHVLEVDLVIIGSADNLFDEEEWGLMSRPLYEWAFFTTTASMELPKVSYFLICC